MQLKRGAKSDGNKLGSVTQPLQFLPRSEKTEEWKRHNLDWLEWQGVKQLSRTARPIIKNFKLAAGIIDKTDYVATPDNDYKDIVLEMTKAGNDLPEALELKFYPIIPNVIDTLESEFAKRNNRISFRAVDEYSYNDKIEQKSSELEQVLLQEAEQKLVMKMVSMGADLEDPQIKQYLEQQTQPEVLKQLPEIQEFYNKDYRALCEEWASKQHVIDEERFKMDELEERAFGHSLRCDREFWHFRMMDDDYEVEVWNPATVFYHKSPDKRYISQSQYAGKIEMLNIPDVIDKYGWLMTEAQLKQLETLYPIRSAGYALGGLQNDGNFYDTTRSHAWNTNPPSLAHRQVTSFVDNYTENGGDIVAWIMNQSEDFLDIGSINKLRVTTGYWKTQEMYGLLTRVDPLTGYVETAFMDESYKITDKPVYDTTVLNVKDERTLISGEHIEWTWINVAMGGVKVGPHFPSYYGHISPGGSIEPIYLGINQNKIGPIRFQFKGDNNPYDCKIPVEGAVFTDENTTSISPVERMKPHQIGYNIVNNQILDILIDEIGAVLVVDHNTIPQHSLNEDWGKHNYAKFYHVMKDFSIAPLDTSMSNTENALNFQHFQQLNMEESARILSRVQLANFFKAQCFENIGVVPQRMGQQIGQNETATGIEQAVTGSYAQTEKLFIRHSDHLMPRVHQMRTDLAQWYHSNKSSIRLQYSTSNDERMNFELNGTDLLLRDINVYASAKANHRHILQRLQSLAETNNTSGATLYDLGELMQADSIGSLNSILKDIDNKAARIRQEEAEHQRQLKEMEAAARKEEELIKNDHERMLQEMKNRTNVVVAEIRAAGFGALKDINQNLQSDYIDAIEQIRKTSEYQESTALNREKESNRKGESREKLALEAEKLKTQKELKTIDLEIARENKNKYDVKSSNDKKP